MSSRTAKLAAPLILAVLMLFAFSQARGRAMDPLIDVGRDLYIADRIAAGQTLYQDFVYNYPPATPYLLAGFVSLAGASLAAFEFLGVAIALVTLIALYAIASRLAGRVAAFVCGLLFISLSFTGASTWGANYLFPYAHASTIGMMFSLLFLWALLRYLGPLGRSEDAPGVAASRVQRETSHWLFAFVILCAGIASLSKIEYALPVLVTFLAVMLFHGLPRLHVIAAAAAAVLTLLGLSGVFGGSPLALGWIADNLLGSSLLDAESTRRFYAEVSGTADWPRNLGLAASGAAAVILVAAALAGIERRRDRRSTDPLLILLLVAVSIGVWALSHGHFFRGWFILQIVLLFFLLARDRRSPLLILVIFSIAATLRVALNLTPDWYGFALIVPVYLVIVCSLFQFLPSLNVYGRRTALLWLPLFLMLAAEGLMQQRERYAMKRYRVETERGHFFDANPDRARALTELLAYLEMRKAKSLVVMPEGVSINYFSGIPTPLTRYQFIPPETSDPAVENSVIEELRRTQPELVAIVSRNMSEFGSQGFGVDYNLALHRAITERYVIERGWLLEGFQVLLLRKSSQESGVRSQ